MKQIVIYALSGLLLLPSLVACSQDDREEVIVQQEQREQITFTASLEDFGSYEILSAEDGTPLSTEARMFFENKESNGANDGVWLRYAEGEKVKASLFFKQGSTVATTSEVFTVKKQENGRYILNPQAVTVPSNINLSAGNVEVAGAIGVTNPRYEQGQLRVDIPKSSVLINSDEGYSVPMTFPLTKVIKSTKTANAYDFYADFKLYGAIVGLKVNNPHKSSYTVKELDIKTSAFDTEGTLNLAAPSQIQGWTTTQGASTVMTVELTSKNKNFTVPVGGSKHFFFWVRPKSALIQGTTMTVGLKSFESASFNPTATDGFDAGKPEVEFRVPVNKVLAYNKVHRITQSITAPLPGELIITEVFLGTFAWNVAIELYNSSDHDVDLKDYLFRSYDPSKGTDSWSPLLHAENNSCLLLHDKKTGETYQGAGAVLSQNKARKLYQAHVDGKHYILKPGEMAVFVEKSVTWDKNQVSSRPKCMYVFNFGDDLYKGFHIFKQGGYLELRKITGAGIPNPRNTKIIDVFLKMKSPEGQAQLSNQPSDVWSFTMMRKPDRNVPRQYMEQGINSDWVGRLRTESIDWGYRFGYESIVYNGIRTNRWFDGKDQQYGFLREDGMSDRVINNLNTNPKNAGFIRVFNKKTEYVYTVPKTWIRPVAH